jgi:hypothetical protein
VISIIRRIFGRTSAEDETFRRLARMPYEEILEIYRSKIMFSKTAEKADKRLRKYGWTFDDFEREYEKRYK